MTAGHVEVWNDNRLSVKEINRRIEAYVLEHRPKAIGAYEENGHTVTVYEARHV